MRATDRCPSCGGQTPPGRFCARCGGNLEPAKGEVSRDRPSQASWWKRFMGAGIGIVVAMTFGGMFIRVIFLNIGGVETIGDLPEGLNALRTLANIALTIFGGVIGYRIGTGG